MVRVRSCKHNYDIAVIYRIFKLLCQKKKIWVVSCIRMQDEGEEDGVRYLYYSVYYDLLNFLQMELVCGTHLEKYNLFVIIMILIVLHNTNKSFSHILDIDVFYNLA